MKHGYKIILADPPWKFRSRAGGASKKGAGWNSGSEKHYPVMTVKQIAALGNDIDKLAADDCALFLWITGAMANEGLHTLESWGFSYTTVAFTWAKTGRMGMGFWTRQAAEFILFGKRGRPQRKARNVVSLIQAPVGRHSQKPDIFRKAIVRLMGNVGRVELFARDQARGWDAWGHGITGEETLEAFAQRNGRADRAIGG